MYTFGVKIDKYSDVQSMEKHTVYNFFNFNTKVNA